MRAAHQGRRHLGQLLLLATFLDISAQQARNGKGIQRASNNIKCYTRNSFWHSTASPDDTAAAAAAAAAAAVSPCIASLHRLCARGGGSAVMAPLSRAQRNRFQVWKAPSPVTDSSSPTSRLHAGIYIGTFSSLLRYSLRVSSSVFVCCVVTVVNASSPFPPRCRERSHR